VTIETLSCSIKAGTTPVAVITDPTPVVVDEDEMPVIEANDQTTPTAEIEPTTEADIDPTIAITEVMANPCNTEVTGVIDQYVELYNYGNNPVDISEWWLVSATVSHTDHHDQLVKIVSWNTRNPFIDLGSHLIQDQTVLNPKQYALVLHPLYGSAGSGSMTYRLPPDTVILTAAEGLSNIAGKFFSTTRPNIVALYIGSQDQINEVISTYGTPNALLPGSSPLDITDDRLDDIPWSAIRCNSAHRINLAGPDTQQNWTVRIAEPGVHVLDTE
jgi:hypothetical protein